MIANLRKKNGEHEFYLGKFQSDRRFNIIIWSITAFDIRDLRRFTANYVLIHHSFDSVSTVIYC